MEEEHIGDENLDSDSGEGSLSDDEMEEDQLRIEPRELQQALLDEEKNGTALAEIKELWDSAQPVITDPQEGISLYTTYIYLLRRMGENFNELKQVFLKGQAVLSELFGQYWDENVNYRRNYAYFLYSKVKQPDEALNVWKDILASEWGTDQYMWIEAVRLERHFGNVELARQLLYQGINSKFDDSYDFFQYFIQFEREEGTREQVDTALQKINAASRAVRNKPQQQQQNRRNDRNEKSADRKPNKRKADKQSDPEKFKKVVKVSEPNKPDSTSKPEKSSDSAPKPEKSSDSAPKPEKSSDAPPKEPVVYASGEEKTKLFVRNVDFKTTTEQLQTFFSQYGNTKEVRIVHHRTGKPKGFAYVEYFDEETAQKALAAHQQVFNGRTLQVYISDPSIGKQQKSERPSGPKPPKFNRGHANGKSEEPKAPVLGGGFARSSTGFSLKPRIVLNK